MSHEIFRLLSFRNSIRNFNCIRFRPVSNVLLYKRYSSPPKGLSRLRSRLLEFLMLRLRVGFGRFTPKQQDDNQVQNSEKTNVENKTDQKKAEGS